jgi:tetratricopeptide (TPR) repeat protein
MRSIEDLADEENARLWEERSQSFKGFLWSCGIFLGPWGWFLFARGSMGLGACLVLASFLALCLAGGAFRNASFSPPAFMLGLGVFLFSGTLYFFSRMPVFFWGKDPSFWTAVQEGTVVEPFWSPLSYLAGQAGVFLTGHGDMSFLPLVTALFLALGVGLWGYEVFLRSPNQTPFIWSFIFLTGMVLGLTMPFWNLGTLASGLPATLGFFLFVLLQCFTLREEKPWPAILLIGALLFSVHPFWGILGALVIGSHREIAKVPRWQTSLCVLTGLSPYLWLILRANKVFPSWGGKNPLWTALSHWRSLWKDHWMGEGPDAAFLFSRTGWVAGGLLVLALLSLLCFGLFAKGERRSLTTGAGFWVWVLSGVGGILFASRGTETLGPTFLWFLSEGCFFFVRGLEGMAGLTDRRSGRTLEGVLASLVFFAGLFTISFWQGQEFWRKDFYFPAQHAENLLRTLGPRSLLICDDPFQNWACVATQRTLGPVRHSVVLNGKDLGQKWFASQVMDKEPEILFSRASGSHSTVLARFILDNQNQWKVLLDQPFPMEKGTGLKSYALGLTRLFASSLPQDLRPEVTQARFDLVGLPSPQDTQDPWTLHYLASYVEGFNQMGLGLMDQGRYSEAIRSFDRALKLDPTFKEAQDHLAWLYSQKNMLEAAQLDFEATLRNHPAKIAELMRSLEGSKAAGQEARTVELLDRIIHLNAELANSQYQLSKIYDKEGRVADARVLLEASVALNPKQFEAQMGLGRLMKQMGDKLRAREAFHEALVLDPLNKEAQVEYWKALNNR